MTAGHNISTVSQCLSATDNSLWDDMLTYGCETSYADVCYAAYEDNPPFSCTKEERSSTLSIFANAWSNTEFAFLVCSTLIIFLLDYISETSYYERNENGNYVKVVDRAGVHKSERRGQSRRAFSSRLKCWRLKKSSRNEKVYGEGVEVEMQEEHNNSPV